MQSIASVRSTIATASTLNNSQQTLVVFDERVTDIATLQAALVPGCTSIIISATETAVISSITAQLSLVNATKLAIVAHGEPGTIHLGAQPLNVATLKQQSGLLAEWGVAEIALYACEVGADSPFVVELGQLTSAKVGAASGKVGAAALGGSWALSGSLAPAFAVEQLVNYSDVLVTFTGTEGSDIITPNTSPATIVGFTGGTVAELADSTGDTFNGLGGNDNIVGSTGADTIYGGEGNDSIQGGGGADSIFGENGDDFINGIFGLDTIDGGAGRDTILITVAPAVVDFNTATDAQLINVEAIFATGSAAGITINLSNQTEGFLIGSQWDNAIIGSQGFDTVVLTPLNGSYAPSTDGLLSGVEAVSAENITSGGTINLSTQTESFIITGSGGVSASSNVDILMGGSGNDTIIGGAGIDYMAGGAGNDSLTGGTEGDYLDGGADADTLNGNEGNDTLYGGTGNDILNGSTGADYLLGEDGNDTLTGDTGNDTLIGGSGLDSLVGGDDADLLVGGDDADTLDGGAGDDVMVGDAGNDYILGDDGNDYILGDSGSDTLLGEAGNDYLYGGGDADVLDGGFNNDTLFGDDGNDTLYGGEGNDFLIAGEGYGTDTNYLVGDEGNDVLVGSNGTDTLLGGTDSDLLVGGLGNDDFIFGDSTLTFGVLGIDTVYDFATGDKFILDQATFTALTSITGDGFSVANEFSSVSGSADTNSALIVYDSSSGALFYNQNGAAAGFGEGGQFALITGAPSSLSASDFKIINSTVV
jgi:Ca2+-binding RTX toxin-like protein